MNKLYSKLFIVLVLAFAIGGCKVDAPVYPEGTVSTVGKPKPATGTDNGTGTGTNPGTGTGTNPGTGTGTNPGTGTGTNPGTGTGTNPGTGTGTNPGTGTDPGTGTENTGDGLPIGATNTIQIRYTAGGAIKTYKNNVSITALMGFITVGAIESQSSIITFGLTDTAVGTYDLFALQTEDYYMDPLSIGKVKVTESSFNQSTGKGTIKGTFSLDMTDGTTTYKHVLGSFNISK